MALGGGWRQLKEGRCWLVVEKRDGRSSALVDQRIKRSLVEGKRGKERWIRGGREIRELLSNGRWVRAGALDICYRPSCILRGVVLVRRGVGRGVRRMRGKRLAREVWRRRCRDIVGEWEIGIVVKRAPAGFWELWNEFDRVMRKAGLISGKL